MNLLNEKLASLNSTEARIVRSIEGAQKRLREVQDEKRKVLRQLERDHDPDRFGPPLYMVGKYYADGSVNPNYREE